MFHKVALNSTKIINPGLQKKSKDHAEKNNVCITNGRDLRLGKKKINQLGTLTKSFT